MESNKPSPYQDQERFFTFDVKNVEICTKLPQLATAEEIVHKTIGINKKFEDFSYRRNNKVAFLKGEVPGFILTLHTAYQNHYPLKLSVSDFIILIGQGLGRHIKENAEKLREYFVSHQGKKAIVIFREDLVPAHNNDWSTIFAEFVDQIRGNVKADIFDIVVDDTSVATRDSRIVSEITLMDCMKSYFEYIVASTCGIPRITLEGSPEDWEKLRQKVKKLEEMNKDDCLELDWWLGKLIPIIDKICDTGVNRKVDLDFWEGIYKYAMPGSGSPYISGWCTVFFPYIDLGRNRFFDVKNSIITTTSIPKQVCEVPFKWKSDNYEIPMLFYGGFIGAYFNKETLTVETSHFWAVAYEKKEKGGSCSLI